MGCTGECPADCACNGNTCGGHAPVCSNSYSFTSISVGAIVTAAHLAELETAINQERQNASRRCGGTSPACGSNCPGAYSFTGSRSIGDTILAAFYNNVADANNTCGEYHSTVPTPVASIGDIIEAVHVSTLQSYINQTRNLCICNTFITCSNCGCNGECPGDGAPY